MTLAPIHRSIFLTGPFRGAGPRVAVKDCIDVAGEVTACGSRALATAPVASGDAEVIRRLRDAGCSLVGRVSMHELAYGVTGLNSWTGTALNPHYPLLIPGGSSSGSAAAVAAGLADFALGTDTGGSIRVPAACCGVVGFKPSFGRVSRRGVSPKESSLDCVGPIAGSVAEIERAMAMLSADWVDCPSPTVTRIGVVGTDSTSDVYAKALVNAGLSTETVTLDLKAAQAAGLTIIGRECWQAYAPLLDSGLVGRDVHDRLLAASRITDAELADAEAVRTAFTAEVDALLGTFDALALPTLPIVPPTLAQAHDPAAVIPITAHCRPFNLSGHPAIALPIGEAGGAPLSLQLVGRRGGDEALCALARTIPLFSKGGNP